MATIAVKVVPGASRDGIAGRLGDALKIRVSAAPEGGRANKAVEALLAELLGLRPNQVSVAKGHAQRRKVIQIDGLSQENLDRLLAEALAERTGPGRRN
jgi:uncharacterized protein (TIGR00251 family)